MGLELNCCLTFLPNLSLFYWLYGKSLITQIPHNCVWHWDFTNVQEKDLSQKRSHPVINEWGVIDWLTDTLYSVYMNSIKPNKLNYTDLLYFVGSWKLAKNAKVITQKCRAYAKKCQLWIKWLFLNLSLAQRCVCCNWREINKEIQYFYLLLFFNFNHSFKLILSLMLSQPYFIGFTK